MMVLWIKAIHIIAVIAWMAALLYLPRLMVYHCSAAKGSIQSETFKLMGRRLLRLIATPAMIVAWIAGLWLIYETGAWRSGWMLAKFALVLGLSAMHGIMGKWVKQFAADTNVRPERFYRIANEVPTLLMILIVVLAVVKPF
jgi:putative membrane protein